MLSLSRLAAAGRPTRTSRRRLWIKIMMMTRAKRRNGRRNKNHQDLDETNDDDGDYGNENDDNDQKDYDGGTFDERSRRWACPAARRVGTASDCEQRRYQQFRLFATNHFNAHGERQVADADAAETIAPSLARLAWPVGWCGNNTNNNIRLGMGGSRGAAAGASSSTAHGHIYRRAGGGMSSTTTSSIATRAAQPTYAIRRKTVSVTTTSELLQQQQSCVCTASAVTIAFSTNDRIFAIPS
jgi:hypothetical protein